MDDFAGQQRLTDNLKVFISAAKMRGDALDHVLLSGPPGLGKTTLAYIIASETEAVAEECLKLDTSAKIKACLEAFQAAH